MAHSATAAIEKPAAALPALPLVVFDEITPAAITSNMPHWKFAVRAVEFTGREHQLTLIDHVCRKPLFSEVVDVLANPQRIAVAGGQVADISVSWIGAESILVRSSLPLTRARIVLYVFGH